MRKIRLMKIKLHEKKNIIEKKLYINLRILEFLVYILSIIIVFLYFFVFVMVNIKYPHTNSNILPYSLYIVSSFTHDLIRSYSKYYNISNEWESTLISIY